MSVHRRLVVFVGGFDPRGARHYHQLFKQECGKQSAVTGHQRSVGARERVADGRTRWWVRDNVACTAPAVDTCVDFWDWADVVRGHWPRSPLAVWAQACRTYWRVLTRTLPWLPAIRCVAPYTLLTLAYPLLYALLLMVLGCAAGWGTRAGVLALSGGHGIASVAGGAVGITVVALGVWADRFLHVSWLLRIFNFAAHREAGEKTVLAARLNATARTLAEELREGQWDEILVVGFSVGSVLGVQLVDSVARQVEGEPALLEKLSLVTLGNCIPLFALMPQSMDLREALGRLSNNAALYWADISSPSDSVSFALCDVVGLSLREDAAIWRSGAHVPANPQAMCSPRFHKLFRPRSYALIRRNKMRMHMQYLMAGELPGAYDYFEMVAGRRSLRQYLQDQLIR